MSTAANNFSEHRIARDGGVLYARDYPGAGPPFVLMHGFPDNLRIYDELIPYLMAGGRRVVAFDFLGFGASDKPPGASYSFRQQLGDLEAVVEAMGLGRVVLVPHDFSGFAALNFAIEHPDKVAGLCILNSAYDDTPLVLWPEMIVWFATHALAPLAADFTQDSGRFGWLLKWQQQKFAAPLPSDQARHFEAFMGPIIADNFTVQPSSAAAFVQTAAEFYEELARNSTRLHLVSALDFPVKVIWGELDPYLNTATGKERASRFRNASFHPVTAGHWLQSDAPARVAELMLS